MNTITITGRLTRDPEMRTVASDLKITTFSVAVDRPYGSKEKKVDFFDCKAFRKNAELIQNYFTKGRKILVNGRMVSSKWTDKNGATRTSWEIEVENFEFCDSAKTQQADIPAAPPVMEEIPGGDPFVATDGDLPF